MGPRRLIPRSVSFHLLASSNQKNLQSSKLHPSPETPTSQPKAPKPPNSGTQRYATKARSANGTRSPECATAWMSDASIRLDAGTSAWATSHCWVRGKGVAAEGVSLTHGELIASREWPFFCCNVRAPARPMQGTPPPPPIKNLRINGRCRNLRFGQRFESQPAQKGLQPMLEVIVSPAPCSASLELIPLRTCGEDRC